MNRWIAAILMFNFRLKHVPGVNHKGPDGLSRRRRADDSEGEDEREDKAEEWVDEVLGCGVWMAGLEMAGEGFESWVLMMGEGEWNDEDVIIQSESEGGGRMMLPPDETEKEKEKELEMIRKFLKQLEMPENLSPKARTSFLKRAMFRGFALFAS
ncbi:hypothetical protein Agabi119p4_10580 [Agaricus bisporus var. burnettii]|uniref:Uncharacterized protein n=1 Tax=Agaricus bisporus var. burnettii TaxID=192524 RepID=A0A8H7EWJ9_AGABI|nr:hypothetical protein Agabi119p4_10580 [Agaricus bisporus var. burnettii]